MRKGSITIESMIVIIVVLLILIFLFNTAVKLHTDTVAQAHSALEADKAIIRGGIKVLGMEVTPKDYVRGLDALDDITEQFKVTHNFKEAYEKKVKKILGTQ